MATEAVIILAENKTPGLMLLADLALWNNRRRELLADATDLGADTRRLLAEARDRLG